MSVTKYMSMKQSKYYYQMHFNVILRILVLKTITNKFVINMNLCHTQKCSENMVTWWGLLLSYIILENSRAQ